MYSPGKNTGLKIRHISKHFFTCWWDFPDKENFGLTGWIFCIQKPLQESPAPGGEWRRSLRLPVSTVWWGSQKGHKELCFVGWLWGYFLDFVWVFGVGWLSGSGGCLVFFLRIFPSLRRKYYWSVLKSSQQRLEYCSKVDCGQLLRLSLLSERKGVRTKSTGKAIIKEQGY